MDQISLMSMSQSFGRLFDDVRALLDRELSFGPDQPSKIGSGNVFDNQIVDVSIFAGVKGAD